MTIAPRSPEIDDLVRHFDRVTIGMNVLQRQALAGLLAISLYDRDEVLEALGAAPVYDASEKPLLRPWTTVELAEVAGFPSPPSDCAQTTPQAADADACADHARPSGEGRGA